MGPAGPPARLDVQLRARPRAGVGARARDHPRPHRDRRTPGGHRARGPRAPLGHARRLPEPRAPRRGAGRARRQRPATHGHTTDQATHHLPADLPERLQHYIGGEHVDSADGATFEVLDPVSNETYLHAAAGKAADVDRAVAAARRAFEDGPWPRMLPRERSRVLHRVADIVESRDARLAELESFDSGLPITQALGQARRAAENFRFFADLVVAQTDDAFKVPGRQLNYVNRKPIGVAGLITPWNTPFMLESWKLGPALATGNTVVLKPAEFTPLSASLWAGIFEEAGVPDGRVQPRARARRGGGRRAGQAPGRPAHLVHGREPDRAAHLRQRGAAPEGPVDGARRQVPRRRLRRRRPRGGDRRDDLRGVLAQRRAVHGGQPDPRPARDLRRVRRALRRPGEARRRRPPARGEHRGRRARAPGALRQGHGLHRDRQDRGSARRRRRAARRLPDRQLRGAHRVRRRPARTPGSSRRRSSARSSPSRRSTPTRRRSRWPTA